VQNIDTISKIEERIYDEYPKYKNYNTYLTGNGNIIKRFKTIEENGIKDGNTILINRYDE
jgi:cobalamin biosynthesis Co2+ chelatase CbiK